MEAKQTTSDETNVEQTAADALRYAADCIDELVDKGEPMGPRQTYRRGFNAADDQLVESPLSGKDFEKASDIVGDVTTMALNHEISGKDAAEFYRNRAQSVEN